MLTLFSIPKSFRGHNNVIQRNAIRSWTLLRPECEIILLGDDEGTREAAEEFGVKHIPEIARTEHGTPRLDSMFQAAEGAAQNQILCYVNADIILMDDLMRAVEQVRDWERRSMMSGQRWDLDVENPLDFESNWEEQLRGRLEHSGRLHAATGADYYVYTNGLLGEIPPFAIGRTAWDQWLLYRARANHAALVDVTQAVTAVHQSHDYSHAVGGEESVWGGPEAKRNQRLAGGRAYLFMIKDRTHVLTPKGCKTVFDLWRIWRFLRTVQVLHPSMPLQTGRILGAINRTIDFLSLLRVRIKLSRPNNAS